MKYFYFLLVGLVALAGLYTLTGITIVKWSQYEVTHPQGKFQITKGENSKITIVDFTSYRCGYCKSMHKTINEALELHKDVTYITRPILLGQPPKKDQEDQEEQNEKPQQQPASLEKLAIAAGLQGKFKEIHGLFMEYPQRIVPEELIKESAELYGVDYDLMVKDSESEKVKEILDNNIDDMINYGVKTIPSYIVGNKIYAIGKDLPDLQKFLAIIDQEKN